MAVTDYQGLIKFIETTHFTCGDELIVLFAATKLKQDEGKFDKERLLDFFIEFYRIRERKKLTLEEQCNPLQSTDRNQTLQLINRNPIGVLLKAGILKTFERFDETIFKIIFEHEEDILSKINLRIIKYYSETFGDSITILEDFLSEWEKGINQTIKSDALRNVAGSIEKINLEFMLKYLYQSYSLGAFNKLLNYFQISEREFDEVIDKKMEYYTQFFQDRGKKVEFAEIVKEKKAPKTASDHIQNLTMFFQKLRDESEEEQEKEKSKRKKKK